jgi:hypothetical protein
MAWDTATERSCHSILGGPLTGEPQCVIDSKRRRPHCHQPRPYGGKRKDMGEQGGEICADVQRLVRHVL